MRISVTGKKYVFFCAAVITAFVSFGCREETALWKARQAAARAERSFNEAIERYQALIAESGGTPALYLELGRLYYLKGDYADAVGALARSSGSEAQKLSALANFKAGNFSAALAFFEQSGCSQEECLYYYGMTCEKLHLFDQALASYRKIPAKGAFFLQAQERIGIIEKEAGEAAGINQVSPQTAELIAKAPDPERYPQAGALILSCDESIEVRQDNTQLSTMHYVIKILNERGKEHFSESHVEYDSTYETIELEYARTIRPDGMVVEVGSRHIRDVSKYLNFPLYSNVRVYIISFPEISEGAVIEYKLRVRRTKLINEKDAVFSYPLASTEPILRANFCVTVPADRPLTFQNINERYNISAQTLEPAVHKTEDRITYRWEFRDIPQIIPEPSMPPEVEINPTILASTFKGWDEIYRWWWKLARDKMKPDQAIKEKVRQLIAGKRTQEEKARALYNFCAQKIRYVAVEYGQAGYEPHRAEDIFRNKYGDCKDQSVLLATMLREAGCDARLVLIATKSYYNLREEFPAVLFNHCIAAVEIDGKIVFLDPTAETCPYGDLPVDDQDRTVFVLGENGYRILRTPLFAPGHNLLRQELSIRIREDESIAGDKTVVAEGMYGQAQRYWLLYTPPELIEQALKEKIQDISIGARLERFEASGQEDLNKEVRLTYSFSGPEYLTVAGNLRIMPQLLSMDSSLVAKDRRRYPLDLAVLDTKETVFEVEVPAVFAITYIPESINEDSPWFSLAVAYEKRKNTVRLVQKVEMKKSLISQDEYPAFKEYFESLAKRLKQRIILERALP